MLINNFQGFRVKGGELCKCIPVGQDLRAALVFLFIDDLNDKLDGIFVKFADNIRWSVVSCTLEEKYSCWF